MRADDTNISNTLFGYNISNLGTETKSVARAEDKSITKTLLYGVLPLVLAAGLSAAVQHTSKNKSVSYYAEKLTEGFLGTAVLIAFHSAARIDSNRNYIRAACEDAYSKTLTD